MIDDRLHAELLPGFTQQRIDTGDGVEVAVSHAGHGPPVLLLHGHPQTRLTWTFIAPRLVEAGYSVVTADLRGYGDSAKPAGGPRHVNYAMRVMAADQIAVMRSLGHVRFTVIGHDRGGRLAHRMALDHPHAIASIAVLDICPTATMYAQTTKEFATRYFWWFFFIQPFDVPGCADPRLRAEYLRCYLEPGTIHAICEDCRAAATIDLEHDAADADRRIACPLLALWGAKGSVGQLFDVIVTWQENATSVQGHALDCGHNLQEEVPKALLEELLKFLRQLPD